MNLVLTDVWQLDPTQLACELLQKRLLTQDALGALLDQAEQLSGDDPGVVQSFAISCASVAASLGAQHVQARATYLCARTLAANTEFTAALILIQTAHDLYAAAGRLWDANRTQIGRMSVLIDLGQYREALDIGGSILGFLNRERNPSGDQTSADHVGEIELLSALAHQNKGVCAEQLGEYDTALSSYSEAERHYRALEMHERMGDIANNRGVVLLRLGNGQSALAAFQQASSIFAGHGLALKQAQSQVNVGNAFRLIGQYAQALMAFELAHTLLRPLAAKAAKAVLLLDIADTYLNLNLLKEALITYREVLQLLANTEMRPERASALWGLGSVMAQLSHYQDAIQQLAESAQECAAIGNKPLLVNVLISQAAIQMTLKDKLAATVTLNQALGLMEHQSWPIQQCLIWLLLAEIEAGNIDQAFAYLARAQPIVNSLNLPHLRYRHNLQLGQLHMNMGDDSAAEQSFSAAVTDVELLRANLNEERTRISFLTDKTLAFEALLRLQLKRAVVLQQGEALGVNCAIEQAFSIAERARARTLVDILNHVVDPRVQTRLSQVDQVELQQRLSELTHTYEQIAQFARSPSTPSLASIAALQQHAADEEQEINRLLLRAVSHNPSHFDPLTPPLPLEELRKQLPSDVTILSYYVLGESVLAFIDEPTEYGRRISIAPGNSGVVTTVGLLERPIRRLASQMDRFRIERGVIDMHVHKLTQSTERVLAQLYDLLLRPIEGLLPKTVPGGPTPKLVIVPHGRLHQLPFHAFFNGADYLVDRFEISYAPSTTVLLLCSQRPMPSPQRALVVGVADETIPAVQREIDSVSKLIVCDDVTVDTHATLETFHAQAPGCGLIHLACHGVFYAGNPMFSRLRLQNGWLMAADIMQYDLAGALVTLSACESGLSEPVGGDELLGLVRAFLAAGAATLLVSLWLAQDETTAHMMTEWYSLIQDPTLSLAGALRTAQLNLKAVQPHPYFWANFMLIGKR